MTVGRALLGLAMIVTVVAAACGGSREPVDWNASAAPIVVGAGDSMLVLAAPAITRTFGTRIDETIVAANGQRIDEMVEPLAHILETEGPVDAVFVNLGTNDVIQGRDPATTLQDLERLVAGTEAVPCVILTTVSTFLDLRFGGSTAAAVNARIRELQRADPQRVQVVDWEAAIHAPGGVATLMDDGAVPNDGVHPNSAAGGQWFADGYAAALARCPS